MGGSLVGGYFSVNDYVLLARPGRLPLYGAVVQGRRTSETYDMKEVELRGPNMLSFQLVSGTTRWYIVGCYILLNNLTILMYVERVWQACPWGCLPILGNLNVNLAAPHNKPGKMIAEKVDAMALVDMSSHFCQ